eukprot:gb/GEZN01003547.1/.p1 GENE.gb/GEZN01003547.1/~~gb/GEZN01003547.1/.p1  ORF type:complete len:610 (-),score=63.45 gb/GEZN01003547.1/:321-2075(-)
MRSRGISHLRAQRCLRKERYMTSYRLLHVRAIHHHLSISLNLPPYATTPWHYLASPPTPRRLSTSISLSPFDELVHSLDLPGGADSLSAEQVLRVFCLAGQASQELDLATARVALAPLWDRLCECEHRISPSEIVRVARAAHRLSGTPDAILDLLFDELAAASQLETKKLMAVLKALAQRQNVQDSSISALVLFLMRPASGSAQLKPEELSDVLTLLSKRGCKDQLVLERLGALVSKHSVSLAQDVRVLSAVLSSISRLDVPASESLFSVFADAAVSRVRDMHSREAVTCLLAVQRRNWSHSALLTALTDRLLRSDMDFTAQGVVIVLRALSDNRFGLRDEQTTRLLVENLSAKALQQADHFTSQGVSTLLWALVNLGMASDDVMSHFLRIVVDKASQFEPEDVALTLLSITRLVYPQHILHRQRMTEAVSALLSQVRARSALFPPHAIAATLWAMSRGVLSLTYDSGDEQLRRALSARLITLHHVFSPRDLRMALQALVALKHRPEGFAWFASRLSQKRANFSKQQWLQISIAIKNLQSLPPSSNTSTKKTWQNNDNSRRQPSRASNGNAGEKQQVHKSQRTH